jgi:hypothetical protein
MTLVFLFVAWPVVAVTAAAVLAHRLSRRARAKAARPSNVIPFPGRRAR